MKIKTIVCLLGATFAVSAMADFGNYAKFAKNSDAPPALQACVASNAKLDAEIDELYKAAKARGQISKIEAQHYARMEANIKKLQGSVTAGDFTLAKCQAMTAELDKEKKAIIGMSKNRSVATKPGQAEK